MGKILVFILGLLGSNAAYAAGHPKPAGVPEIFLPEYNKTIAVFAVTSPVGSGLAVLEKQPDGLYTYCGICTYFVTDLANQIDFKGGPKQYIEGVVGEINNILLYQYPPKTAPKPGVTGVDQLNYSLYADGFALRVVNGSPQLGK